jgi:lysosomal acid lipase/cholesteryl ester hydrolase
MHYSNVAPAFQLVRAGYDVWLGNQRGTKYSKAHKWLDPNSKEYWQFSFTEMGEYDATAQVEYALSSTGRSKATFIGHS